MEKFDTSKKIQLISGSIDKVTMESIHSAVQQKYQNPLVLVLKKFMRLTLQIS